MLETAKEAGRLLVAEMWRQVRAEPLWSVAVFIGLLAYFPGLFYRGFVMDDTVAVQRNPLVVGSPSLADYFRKDFWGLDLFAGTWTHKSFRPITTFTYRLNYLVHGLDSTGFHAVNILLHLCVSYMMGRVSRRVFRLSAFWSAAVAGVFAVHPVHTENVLYLVGRADILATLFGILAVVLYFSEKSSLVSVVAAVALSGLAKETGLMLMPAFLGVELLAGVAGKRESTRLAVWTATTLGLLFLRHRHTSGTEINMSVQDNPVQFETDRLTRTLTYAFLHGKYLQLLALPTTLCYDYSLNAIPMLTAVSDVRLLLPLTGYLAVALAGTCAFSKLRQTGDVSGVFGLAVAVLTFFPASNVLFPVGTVVGERLLYLPSAGAVWFLATCVGKSLTGKVAVVGSLVALSVRTFTRTLDWQSAERLFLSDGVRQPKSAKTQFNVGITHMQSQNWEAAVQALVECALADPMSALPYWRIGQVEILRGRFAVAAEWLAEASTKFGATLMVKDEEIFHDLSVALWQIGKRERSEWYMNVALELNANFPKGLNNFGCLALGLKGDAEAALNHVLQAVKLNPTNALYLQNLRFLAERKGDTKLVKKADLKLTQLGVRAVNKNDCVWEFVPAS